nr:DUF4129 domain-containing protein [Propionicimonas sp.]
MSPPLTPDADEARRQLADELAKPIYADVQSWISDQLRKLLDWLTGNPDSTGALSSAQLVAIVAVTVGIAAIAIWTFMGPLRTERRRRADVLAAEERTADELRADATRLAAADEWGEATLQLFRALIRSLSERAVIDEFPGMTADEAVGRAVPRLPGLADRLVRAAGVFDALAYGRRPGTPAQYREMLALDTDAAGARPVLPQDDAADAPPVDVEVVR